LLPDHAPEAVQEVALVEDHVSVAELPLDTDVGLAISDTVGRGSWSLGAGTGSCSLAVSLQAMSVRATRRGANSDARARIEIPAPCAERLLSVKVLISIRE
jgi:hypothetical protein